MMLTLNFTRPEEEVKTLDKELEFCLDYALQDFEWDNGYTIEQLVRVSEKSAYRIEEIISRFNRAYNLNVFVKRVKPTPTHLRNYLRTDANVLLKYDKGWTLATNMTDNGVHIYINSLTYDKEKRLLMADVMDGLDTMYVIMEAQNGGCNCGTCNTR